MKTTLVIDDDLLQAAKKACGAMTDAETINQGLQALVRQAAYRRLRHWEDRNPMRKTCLAAVKNR